MEHGIDDILLGVECTRSRSRSEPKKDLLTHIDICHSHVVDQLNGG